MKARYGLPVGFSDHTLGIAVPIAAVAIGACAIEKHFVLSKEMYGPDAPFSATPDEMKELVKGIRAVEKALGTHMGKDKRSSSMKDMKVAFQKSIVARRDMPAGTVLRGEDLAYKKPGDGISASLYQKFIGRRILVDVLRDTKMTWEMIEE
jgi:N-acetylneuraminate synthase